MAQYKKAFFNYYGLQETKCLSLEDISSLSGIPSDALLIIFFRGNQTIPVEIETFSFHKTRKPAKPKDKGMKRVYEFVMRGKTFDTADKDVAEKYGLI